AGAPDFDKHLGGTQGTGVIPLRDDDTVTWAAIDMDKYNTPTEELEARVRARNLPLFCCQSKSGGTHLYLFLNREHDPDIIRERLAQWAAELGIGGSEIFPKQSYRAGPEDIGNWINMPYFGGATDQPERRCYRDGQWLDLEGFLDAAEAGRVEITGRPAGEGG